MNLHEINQQGIASVLKINPSIKFTVDKIYCSKTRNQLNSEESYIKFLAQFDQNIKIFGTNGIPCSDIFIEQFGKKLTDVTLSNSNNNIPQLIKGMPNLLKLWAVNANSKDFTCD